jgi:hypothetical protein
MDSSARARMRRTLSGWKQSANVSEAFGKLFAALEEGQQLLKDYEVNLHRLKRADRPAWIAERAAGVGLKVEDAFAPDLQEQGRKLGVDLSAAWARFLNEYFAGYAATGNPPEVAPYLGQGSTVIEWPAGEGATVPIAIAWLTPYGSKAKALENFQEAALLLEDRRGSSVDPSTVDDLAKILFMQSYGLKSAEIAWEFLAARFPEIESLDDDSRERDYSREHRREMDRLRQVRSRGLEAVTRIVPSLSRFGD